MNERSAAVRLPSKCAGRQFAVTVAVEVAGARSRANVAAPKWDADSIGEANGTAVCVGITGAGLIVESGACGGAQCAYGCSRRGNSSNTRKQMDNKPDHLG